MEGKDLSDNKTKVTGENAFKRDEVPSECKHKYRNNKKFFF